MKSIPASSVVEKLSKVYTGLPAEKRTAAINAKALANMRGEHGIDTFGCEDDELKFDDKGNLVQDGGVLVEQMGATSDIDTEVSDIYDVRASEIGSEGEIPFIPGESQYQLEEGRRI